MEHLCVMSKCLLRTFSELFVENCAKGYSLFYAILKLLLNVFCKETPVSIQPSDSPALYVYCWFA